MVEGIAAAAVSPGHVVELKSDGEFQKQSTAKKHTLLRVVTENDLVGKTINDAYAADDQLYMHIAKPGDVVQLKVPAAASALVKGDRVELASGGCVRKWTDGTPVGEVELAVDNSAGGAEAFVKVRVY